MHVQVETAIAALVGITVVSHNSCCALTFQPTVRAVSGIRRQRSTNESLVRATSTRLQQAPDITDFGNALELKNSIKELARDTENGVTASKEVQYQIANLAKELEEQNPTADLTTSDKLNGSWTLIYTTNGGSSAGKLGPFVGDVEQLIKDDSYVNYVRIGGSKDGGIIEGALTATWDVLSDDRWQVNFKEVSFKLFGITLTEQPLEAVGIWRKTYLDDDFRILHAIGGKNVEKENIYILAKD